MSENDNAVNNIPIPEGVVDPREYRKYILLTRNPFLRDTIFVTSEGEEINFGMLPDKLRKAIEHLSFSEQEKIWELKRRYNSLRGKIAVSKARAYGRWGCHGGKSRKEWETKPSPFETDVIELLGRMFTVAEVVKIMGEDNGIIINEEDVRDVLKRHVVEIEKKREDFRNKVTDVRLYHKRPRLEELSWMYSKMKMRYLALNSVDTYNALLRTLEQIRKEAEGDILNIRGALDVNIEATIQAHIQQEILKTINLKEIILGRVAARMNYDLGRLVAGLHNSYYAKFVDIGGDYDPSAEMEYPSASAYDFTAIERQHALEEETAKTTGQPSPSDFTPTAVPPETATAAGSLRQLFRNKIAFQRKKVEGRVANWDARGEMDKRTPPPEEHTFNRSRQGRGKDKVPPSQTSQGRYNNRNTEYYSGRDIYRRGEKKK